MKFTRALTTQRVDGPTPMGGKYSIATFLNDKNKPVEKSLATHIRIAEYNEKNKIIATTYGTINSPSSGKVNPRKFVPSPPVVPTFNSNESAFIPPINR
ncbi:MAG: hypothetical protein CMD81_12730 [Gammaproteobacteria bacterium]|nr:hypothetical protein [Gammaproteobacteria bacterium]HBF09865.1 hypothetical protein [Gammaproteobacteria bacterium]|tara:strand:- start:552 stop:848 length:297 start_codon:yes stop_codon:yes gene_type:complete